MELVSIGEAATRYGLSVATLRYWEERGLLQPAARRGGRRLYGPEELYRIGLVQMWQDCGLMSLDDIAAVLAGAGWRTIVTDRIRAIEDQQRRLAAGKAHLEHMLICPSEDPAATCPHLRDVIAERMRGRLVTPEEVHP